MAKQTWEVRFYDTEQEFLDGLPRSVHSGYRKKDAYKLAIEEMHLYAVVKVQSEDREEVYIFTDYNV